MVFLLLHLMMAPKHFEHKHCTFHGPTLEDVGRLRRKGALDYALSAWLPVSDALPITVTTTHFPPGLSAPQRRLTVLRVAAYHAKRPTGIHLMFGKMNGDITDHTGSWLRRLTEDPRY